MTVRIESSRDPVCVPAVRREASYPPRRAPARRALATAACLAVAVGAAQPEFAAESFGPVVLNEVQYHPADDLREDEFVELLNGGTSDVDVGGWSSPEA